MEQLCIDDVLHPKQIMYVIKFTLSNGRVHYGVRDYVKFDNYEDALRYVQEYDCDDCKCDIERLTVVDGIIPPWSGYFIRSRRFC